MLLLLFMAALAAARVAVPTDQHPPIPVLPDLARRALPDSPSGGYAPGVVDCPQTRPKLRSAGSGVSPEEASWLELRRNATVKPMTDFLTRAGIKDFNVADYMSKVAGNVSALPNIAIAMSGGGYRALMNGGGFLAAADDRTPDSTGKGGIGGLLQSATYLSGLSGGGWLVGSIYSNNFSTVGSLQNNERIWKFDRSIIQGPERTTRGLVRIFRSASYWIDVLNQVGRKKSAGFETSLTDYWGRALGYQLIDGHEGGSAYTFSSIARTDSFKRAEYPLPLIVADGRAPNTRIINLNSTVFEFGPFELGSWDPTTYGFAPLQYIASNFSNGEIPDGGKCVRGFDSASFVMGTSSSLFNQILLRNLTAETKDLGIPSALVNVIKGIAERVGDENNDIAQFRPNPFIGYHNDTAGGIATSQELSLVDGGSDGQNLPLQPLIQPARRVDVVFAVDSSADTRYNWPDGAALRATYDRSRDPQGNGTLFPAVPDQRTFLALGLNNRPTFFGCDAGNFSTDGGKVAPPLVVYLPNAPYTAMPNVSTFTPRYPLAQRDDIIRNGFNAATQGNATLDADWPACVACAVLQRSMARASAEFPEQCLSCFRRYCWDGTVVSSSDASAANATADNYQPAFKVSNQTTPLGSADTKRSAGASIISGRDHRSRGLALAGSVAALAALVSVL